MSITSWNHVLTLGKRLLDEKHSTVAFVKPDTEKPLPFGSVSVPLERATPESVGVSSRVIADFLERLQNDDTLNMHSVTVLRYGKVIAEASFRNRETGIWQSVYSAGKSVVALAVGMLIDEGLLHLEDHVTDFFDTQINAFNKIRWRELTVEDLLTMRSGATFNEGDAVCETEWIKTFFASPLQGTVGETFKYNSINTYLLSAIVKKVTGEGLCKFLRPRLFDPLGIGDVYWETCPQGIEKGGWGLYIGCEDIAKLGQLVMQKGNWNGEQLISENWIRTATAAHAQAPAEYGDYDYGYQIWAGRQSPRFLFNGMLGQNVLGFWNNGILVVSYAGNDEMFQQSNFFPIVHETFGGDFPDHIPEDPDGQKLLLHTIDGLKTAYPPLPRLSLWDRLRKKTVSLIPPFCAELKGQTYEAAAPAPSVGLLPLSLQVVTNRYSSGLSFIRFDTEKDRLLITYGQNDAEYLLPVNFYGAEKTTLHFDGDAYLVSMDGRFADDEDGHPVLTVTIDFLETPYIRQLKFRFFKNTLRLEQSERPGDGFVWVYVADTLGDMERNQPLVGGALQKLDMEYAHYKTAHLFSPQIILQKN